MLNEQAWATISTEQQQARLAQLATDERQCRSYLTLARETVEMFHYLTVSRAQGLIKGRTTVVVKKRSDREGQNGRGDNKSGGIMDCLLWIK